MGSSPDALLGWGIDLGDQDSEDGFDWDNADFDSYDLGGKLPELFGFTEEPPERPDGLAGGALTAWHEAVRVPWEARREAAVPLSVESYGYEFGGTLLVLRRSFTQVEWGTTVVQAGTLAPPDGQEQAAFGVVLDYLGYTGPREVRLLLAARYG